MQELSLNVLDIAQNSIRAGASLIAITVTERRADALLEISIADNGCGMSREQVDRVMDPFFTTRTTRKVGLGVPFFKMSAEATGGDFSIVSELGAGTTTTARYHTDHLDMLPIGDMNATILSLITMNPSTPLISTIPSPSLPIPLFYRFLQDFPLYAHTSPSFQSAPLIWCIQSDRSLPVSLFLQKTEFYNEVGC